MHHFLKALVYFSLFSFIISCDKEYSIDAYNTSPFAKGTLKDSTGDCMHDSAIGNYYKGITPNADSNYVELKMRVIQPGYYHILTNMQNGFRFADSGYVFNDGYTTLHLKSAGTPIAEQATFFTLSFNKDVCYFYVHVQ